MAISPSSIQRDNIQSSSCNQQGKCKPLSAGYYHNLKNPEELEIKFHQEMMGFFTSDSPESNKKTLICTSKTNCDLTNLGNENVGILKVKKEILSHSTFVAHMDAGFFLKKKIRIKNWNSQTKRKSINN